MSRFQTCETRWCYHDASTSHFWLKIAQKVLFEMPKNPYKLISPQAGRHSEVCERRNTVADETTPAATAARRRYTFHRRPKALYKKKHKVLCSGFLPNTSPMQQSCSHYNVFRSITSQTCTYLRTWQHEMTTIMQPFHCDLQPQIQDTHTNTHRNNHLLQNTEEEHIRGWNGRSRNRRTHEVPFIAGWSHFTRKNIRFRAPASSPTQGPCNIHAAITKAPLPKVATSLRHHFPKSPHSLCHHLPSSPLALVSHRPSSMSILVWCIVMWCQVSHHPSSMSVLCDVLLSDVKSHITIHQCQFFCDVLECDVKSHTTLHQCQVSQFYLSVTRKYCFPTSFDQWIWYIYIYIYRQNWIGIKPFDRMGISGFVPMALRSLRDSFFL